MKPVHDILIDGAVGHVESFFESAPAGATANALAKARADVLAQAKNKRSGEKAFQSTLAWLAIVTYKNTEKTSKVKRSSHMFWNGENDRVECINFSKTAFFRDIPGNTGPLVRAAYDALVKHQIIIEKWTGSNKPVEYGPDKKYERGNSAIYASFGFLLHTHHHMKRVLAALISIADFNEQTTPHEDDVVLNACAIRNRLYANIDDVPRLSKESSEAIANNIREAFACSSTKQSMTMSMSTHLLDLVKTRDADGRIYHLCTEGDSRYYSFGIHGAGFTNMPKAARNIALKNFTEFDISAASPVLMLGHARTVIKKFDEKFPLALEFLRDPDGVRRRIADAADVPLSAVKELINTSVFGPTIFSSTNLWRLDTALLKHGERSNISIVCHFNGRRYRLIKNEARRDFLLNSPLGKLVDQIQLVRARLIPKIKHSDQCEIQLRELTAKEQSHVEWLNEQRVIKNKERAEKGLWLLRPLVPKSYAITNELEREKDFRKWKRGSILAHVFFAIETMIMNMIRNIIGTEYEKDIVHVHDAFFVYDPDKKITAKWLEEQTLKAGYILRFKETAL